jgi:hypothetical protein
MTILTILTIPLTSSIGVLIIKSIQMFDYLNFIDIDVPQNTKAFIEIFDNNILNFTPNLFEKKEYDTGDAVDSTKQRILVEFGN